MQLPQDSQSRQNRNKVHNTHVPCLTIDNPNLLIIMCTRKVGTNLLEFSIWRRGGWGEGGKRASKVLTQTVVNICITEDNNA